MAADVAGDKVPFVSLDNATALAAAREDPVGSLRGINRVVIAEIQRAPNLLLSIKTDVDRDIQAGRFLLIRSTNLMPLHKVAASLARRMETVRLLPLAQAELLGQTSAFIDNPFAHKPPAGNFGILGLALIETFCQVAIPKPSPVENGHADRIGTTVTSKPS